MSTNALTVYDTPWFESPDEVEAAARSAAALPVGKPPLGDRSFFERKSPSELAREQGVGPVKDIRVFAGGFPEGEDLDELLAELDELRRS